MHAAGITGSVPDAARLPASALPVQVTREVGQECLKLQERMRGGLLGAGHSWVGPPPTGGSDASAAATDGDDRPAAAVAAAVPDPAAPGVLYRLADRMYNAVEDAKDVLAEDFVHFRASGSRLLGSALAAGGVLLLRYMWQHR